MNAYELADELEWHWDNDCRSPAISKSADMLRQQADRIAELEKKSKPVAWMMKYRNKKISLSFDKFQLEEDNTNYFNIPLYTTPQTKPLSDEEIMQISHQALENSALIPKNNFMIAFARAIEERHGIK